MKTNLLVPHDDLCSLYWAYELGVGTKIFFNFVVVYNYHAITVGFAGVFAVPLAVIILLSACVSSGWTGLIRSLTLSSSSYRYSTTLGSTATLRDAVPSPILMRNSPHEWILAKKNLVDPLQRKK